MIATLLKLMAPLTLICACVLLWVFAQQRERAEATTALLTEQRAQLTRQNETLAAELATERTAQTRLRATQNALRTELARRRATIKDLKHENQELREWAAQPLPAAARRLRERPAIAGADAYRDWLSGRGAVPPAGDGAER